MLREDKIAEALKKAKAAAAGTHILKSNSLSRSERELLLTTGWLQEIIRGWYMLLRPDIAKGDTTAWYVNFWDFIHLYLQDRFGEQYCLAAESSLDLHTEKPTIPSQLVIMAHQGGGITKLMQGLSLVIYVDEKNFPEHIVKKNKLNVMELPYALCKVSPTYFQKNSRDAELALRSIPTAADLVRVLARYHLKAAAGRLAGAYQFLGNTSFSKEIQSDLQQLGMKITLSNPFKLKKAFLQNIRITSPYAGRIRAMWAEARETVEKHFPPPPGLPRNAKGYLQSIDEIYQFDAYNSLSIEGYQVSDELIEHVKSKRWHPERNESDHEMKNAMAARGYFDTFQLVKKDIEKILLGKSSVANIKKNLQKWYQALFGPSVKAGIIPADTLFGYRNDRVFIRNSIHSPPPKEAVPDAMIAFFDCLKSENHAGIRAVLGHYFFVFIHPYMDGNGRIGRFIMNALLAEGGYPWTVVLVKHRKQYIDTLENTHQNFNLKAFTTFIKNEMELSN